MSSANDSCGTGPLQIAALVRCGLSTTPSPFERISPPRRTLSIINVLIAHGQRLYAEALGIALRRAGDRDLVVLSEHPASGEAVLDAVLAFDPHLLLLDFWIPRHPQMNLLGDLRRRVPDVKVVLLSKHHGPHHIQEALNAGATGFLPTGLSVEQVAEALRQAHAGAPLTFAPELANLVDQIQHRVQDSTRRFQLLRTLTPREVEILQLLAEGRPGKDASKELGIAHGSFKNAVRSIVAKTRARTHIDAVNMARYEGMVPQPAPRSCGRCCRRWRGGRPPRRREEQTRADRTDGTAAHDFRPIAVTLAHRYAYAGPPGPCSTWSRTPKHQPAQHRLTGHRPKRFTAVPSCACASHGAEEPLGEGRGYWAWSSCTRLVDVGAGASSARFPLGAYHASMVGNPSGTAPSTVSGHDFAATWDPDANNGAGTYRISGYRKTISLAVGQGAWAFAYSPTQVTVRTG